ncbi:MAG: lipoyl(octanoyl) transferase LipB [Thermodesulfobacteriota bacterium]
MFQSESDRFLCGTYRLGILEYGMALALQSRLAEARARQEIADTLLLLQHPSVITLGKSARADHVLDPGAANEKNIRIFATDRGGDVTYHGPGQLVVYPILNLNDHRLNVGGYVWSLEEVVIRVLSRFGIAAGREDKLRGVWVGREKICSLGVHLSSGISKHGLALNVKNDLTPFGLINPCGTGRPVTSMARILGRSLDMEEVASLTLRAFSEVFRFNLREEPPEGLDPYR